MEPLSSRHKTDQSDKTQQVSASTKVRASTSAPTAALAAESQTKTPKLNNLFQQLPQDQSQEQFEALLTQPGVKLERIVSNGQSTPEGEWYDQAWDEWVMILQGAAGLLIEGQQTLQMGLGDSILLPAHCRHRVEWTSPEQTTIWLALHLGDGGTD